MIRGFLFFLFVVLTGCSGNSIFHKIGGTTNYPSTRAHIVQVDITKRSTLLKCNAELLGTIERAEPNSIPNMVAKIGGTHYIVIGHTVEVWHINNEECCIQKFK